MLSAIADTALLPLSFSFSLFFFFGLTWLFEGIVLPIMARMGGVSEPLLDGVNTERACNVM